MGEERTGPMWYRRFTRFDEPSNFLEVERGLGGSLGLWYSGCALRVCTFGEVEEEVDRSKKKRERKGKKWGKGKDMILLGGKKKFEVRGMRGMEFKGVVWEENQNGWWQLPFCAHFFSFFSLLGFFLCVWYSHFGFFMENWEPALVHVWFKCTFLVSIIFKQNCTGKIKIITLIYVLSMQIRTYE